MSDESSIQSKAEAVRKQAEFARRQAEAARAVVEGDMPQRQPLIVVDTRGEEEEEEGGRIVVCNEEDLVSLLHALSSEELAILLQHAGTISSVVADELAKRLVAANAAKRAKEDQAG
jgi:RNA 3'-terminal phosphate cyclase